MASGGGSAEGRRPGLTAAMVESAVARGIDIRFEVDGYSMQPLIRPGDVVRLRPANPARVRSGDVVAVLGKEGGNLLVHRVVGRRGPLVIVRGDNAPRADGEFDPRELLGTVCAVERGRRSVWFGAGRWGPLVAGLVRLGLLRAAMKGASGAGRRRPGGRA